MFLIDFREMKGERKKEREKDRSVAFCMCPNWGSNPKPRHVPRLGLEPMTFWCMGLHSNQLSHTARAPQITLKQKQTVIF